MKRWIPIGVVGLACAGLLIAEAASSVMIGRQSDGSVITSTGQSLTPAGRQVEFAGRPAAVALSPDSKTAAYLTGTTRSAITLVDLASGAVKQSFDPGDRSASFDGILYSPDGTHLYASLASGKIVIANVASDATLSLGALMALPATNGNPYPGGLALSDDGKTLYVTLSRDNALGIIDLVAQKFVKEIPVGNAPHSVVVRGQTAYVSNQGGRKAVPGDFTNDSSGTAIVADPNTGGSTTGSVSVVDLAGQAQRASIDVGLQPTALLLVADNLLVANTNSDSIGVIDLGTNRVLKTIDVKPFDRAPFGSSPNALAMIDANRLAVSLGRNNAVAVYRWKGASEPAKLEGLIPTGWYPASLAVDSVKHQLVVANDKGVGSLGPEASVGPDPSTRRLGKYVHSNLGSTSIIPLPAAGDLQRFTEQVIRNNHWVDIEHDRDTANALRTSTSREDDQGGQPVPDEIGNPSPIKHVFFIIKENRTYDQVLGDLGKGNGDPRLAAFGAHVTPNHHALADQFVTLDNFYASGSLSADGHQWVVQANVPDYLEKAFGGFIRSYPYNGGDSLAYLPSGFLWDNALRHQRTVRAYGEYSNEFKGPAKQMGTWSDWWHDAQILSGAASGDLHVPLGTFQARSDVPSLDKVLNRDFPGFVMSIPDQYRVEIFLREFNQYVATDTLPNLITMTLPDDHTAGVSSGLPDPTHMVADNDLAFGRVVEAISKSPYWKSSAIFVVEDDAQNGVDHVDGHRTLGYLISPWVQRGLVDSTYYSQIDMVRTIEQILGLPPTNQLDLATPPMRRLFSNKADLTPYTAMPSNIALDTVVGAESTFADVERTWVQASNSMGFSRSTTPDENDERVLNRAIWYSATGFTQPYPGDEKVLSAIEVTGDDD